jgi:hypothetical protein
LNEDQIAFDGGDLASDEGDFALVREFSQLFGNL